MAMFGWLFDSKRCIDCKACEAACKQWNGVQTSIEVRYRRVLRFEDGQFPKVRLNFLSMACNHCEDATCLKVCPTKSIFRRDDGIILIGHDTCVGCELCSKFCPYDALHFNRTNQKMEKCTMCASRIDAEISPACATVCPTGALVWGEWDKIKELGADRMENFSSPVLTKPAIRFVNTSWKNEG